LSHKDFLARAEKLFTILISACSPKIAKQAIKYYKTHGLQAFVKKAANIAFKRNSDILYHHIPQVLDKTCTDTWKWTPNISIILAVEKEDLKQLASVLEAIKKQCYPYYRLYLATNKDNLEAISFFSSCSKENVELILSETNQDRAELENLAISKANGDYFLFIMPTTILTSDALFEFAKSVITSSVDLVYSDEDIIVKGKNYTKAIFKPDYSPDLLLTGNYIGNVFLVKKQLVNSISGDTHHNHLAKHFELILKALERQAEIHHIAKVLYHSSAMDSSKKAIQTVSERQAISDSLSRQNIDARVETGLTKQTHKVTYLIKDEPQVSIIFSIQHDFRTTLNSLRSIVANTSYNDWELLVVADLNINPEMVLAIAALDSRITLLKYDGKLYEKLNYAALKESNGEQLVFISSDSKVMTRNWIQELLQHAQRNEVGAVSSKVLYLNNLIYHAGYILTPYTSHGLLSSHINYKNIEEGYLSKLKRLSNYSAVSYNGMMCKKSVFVRLGGFDFNQFPSYMADIDLCLRLQQQGYFNLLTPYSQIYLEKDWPDVSINDDLATIERKGKELFLLKQKHPHEFSTMDKFYNKNFSPDSTAPMLHPEKDMKLTKDFIAQDFKETIIYLNENNATQKKQRVCIFSHFDRRGIIDEYVIYYLTQLSKISDIVFISTADNMENGELNKIHHLCLTTVVKENIGYDFGAWKTGLALLGNTIDNYEQLILCNDSVFGPFYDLSFIFEQMDIQGFDVWAMTDNLQITPHLQSYFCVYNSQAFNHPIFKSFWQNFKIYTNKYKLIEMNEIKFSEQLLNSTLSVGSYCPSEKLGYVNTSHYYWKELIMNYHYPFLKKELIRDNPMQLDISGWETCIRSISDYDTNLIHKHLH